ncbi:hypothetical protein BsWGS_27994 [Bradybaena similaris]
MATVRRKNDVKFSVMTSLVFTVSLYFVLTQLQAAAAGILHLDPCKHNDTCQHIMKCHPDQNKCVCPASEYYFDSFTKQCEPGGKLDITNSKCVGHIDSISCSLSQNDSLSIIYELLVDSSGQMQRFSQGRANIPNLSPGTQYFVKIRSSINNFGQDYAKNRSSGIIVWTKPAEAGPVTSVKVTKRPDAPANFSYDITFNASRGNVSKYVFKIDKQKYQLDKPKVSNVTLRAGTKYDCNITSFNGNNDTSNVIKSLTTPPEKSSEVRNLNVTPEPCSTSVTWHSPEYPNGNISHYQLNLKALDTNDRCEWNCTPSANCTQFESSASDQGSGVNCSTEDFSSGGDVFSVRLPDLKPNTNYNVMITAVNDVGLGLTQSEKFETPIAAVNVSNIRLSSVRDSTSADPRTGRIKLKISWDSNTSLGIISYNVEIRKARSRNSNEFVYDQNRTGIIDRETEFDDVLAHWHYTAHIQTVSCKGENNAISSSPIITAENNPGKVQNLQVVQNEIEATNVSVTFDCLEEAELNGTIDKYVIKVTALNDTQDKEFRLLPNSCGNPNNLKTLVVGKQYEFAVKAESQNYSGEYSEPKNLTAVPRKPLLAKKYPIVTDIINPKSAGAAINVEVCVACIRDSSQGNVVHTGLIVCVFGDQSNCGNSFGDQSNSESNNFTDFITWKKSRETGFKKPYRTTSDDWTNNLKMMDGAYMSFNVGVDSNCDNYPEDNYCNGLLPGGKDVFISVVVCTTAGCGRLEAGKVYVSEKPEKSIDATAITLSILAILVFICIIAVLVTRRFFPWTWKWLVKRPADNEPGIPEKRPVKMRDFEEHMKKLHKDSDLLLQGEFEDIKTICMTFKNSHNEAQREANRVKNRFVDILPYDHSRVKLNVQPEDEETNDFINANYIPGYNSVREYIATQGPMNCTIPDFWCMIWEQKCLIIVMVSDLQENGRLKVDQYWPENLHESVIFENVAVEMTNFSQLNKYIIRSFKLSKGAETRKVTQYFLPGWCDFSANLTFSDVLELAKLMRQEITPDASGPITVHCSAGVGRTGTFIALDYFSQFVDQHSLDDEIDIYEYVLKMRRNRPRMVQAEIQYIFIYDAVNEMIKKKMQMEQERLYDEVESDGNANLTERKKNEENTYVEIQLNDEKCVYNNGGFESDNSNTDAEQTVLKQATEP